MARSKMKALYGVIPAAGEGLRARPDSLKHPKCLIKINGTTLLERNIELMRDQLGINEIIIIAGYLGSMVEDYIQERSWGGVNLRLVRNHNIERGMAWSIYLSRGFVDDYFCVLLADECYLGSNHYQLGSVDYRRSLVTCALKRDETADKIRENYSVRLDERGLIRHLVEKPEMPENDLLGCGTFVLSPAIFPLLEKAFVQSGSRVDFISFLDTLCRRGYRLQPFWLEGGYVNVNDAAGIKRAALLDVSFPSSNEKRLEKKHHPG